MQAYANEAERADIYDNFKLENLLVSMICIKIFPRYKGYISVAFRNEMV